MKLDNNSFNYQLDLTEREYGSVMALEWQRRGLAQSRSFILSI